MQFSSSTQSSLQIGDIVLVTHLRVRNLGPEPKSAHKVSGSRFHRLLFTETTVWSQLKKNKSLVSIKHPFVPSFTFLFIIWRKRARVRVRVKVRVGIRVQVKVRVRVRVSGKD